MKSKLTMELVGTAILVFTIQVSVSLDSSMAPLAIGGILMAIVFAGGPISGAHYNPAVSLAVALRGSMSNKEMIHYWVAQFIGAILGGLCGGIVAANSYSVAQIGNDSTLFQALLAELIFTFVLCLIVLCVATNSKVDNNHYYGLAIGLVVMAGAITVGPVSGGAFNPAVALGLSAVSGFKNFGYGMLVAVANLFGGVAAAGCFFTIVPEEFEVATVGETMPLNNT